MSIQDVALAFLVSQQANHNAIQEEMARLSEENAKLKAEQLAERLANPKPKKGKAPIHQVVETVGMLRSPTVETSHEFLKAMRAAKSREESIAAIDLFVGYNLAGNFGEQDVRARMLAQSTLRPISTTGPTPQEQRSACRSAAGFVHGLPDHQAKQLANLRAQVERVIDAMMTCEKDGNTVGVAIESERLAHLRLQIKSLGFDH
jgi:hypothetical protein